MTQLLEIGTVSAKPGELRKGYLSGGYFPDGSEVRIPLCIIHGKEPGPVLWVQACMHGYEYEGMLAIHQILRDLKPESLSGAVVAVPALNLPSFYVRDRGSWIDQRDFNRQFPGNPDGAFGQQLAFSLAEIISSTCDYAIDMHSGGTYGRVGDWVIYGQASEEVGEEALTLAKLWGHRYIYASPQSSELSQSFYHSCAQRGVPAILTEAGGGGVNIEGTVQSNVTGIWNVLRGLGMTPGEPKIPASYQMVSEWVQIFSHRGGIFEPAVEPNEVVEEGHLLGRIVDVYGEPQESVESPVYGVIVGVLHFPVVGSGERILQIGRLSNQNT